MLADVSVAKYAPSAAFNRLVLPANERISYSSAGQVVGRQKIFLISNTFARHSKRLLFFVVKYSRPFDNYTAVGDTIFADVRPMWAPRVLLTWAVR